ncbi:MAG TPA: hypothetical protein VK488_03855 [Gaiellaceae bacterium]|nr:hypothetical protein [Gaiellaceae bacterium]
MAVELDLPNGHSSPNGHANRVSKDFPRAVLEFDRNSIVFQLDSRPTPRRSDYRGRLLDPIQQPAKGSLPGRIGDEHQHVARFRPIDASPPLGIRRR